MENKCLVYDKLASSGASQVSEKGLDTLLNVAVCCLAVLRWSRIARDLNDADEHFYKKFF